VKIKMPFFTIARAVLGFKVSNPSVLNVMPRLIPSLTGALLGFALSASASSPGNILLIIADDYGADSSSLYNSGATLPPTPNLISLAQNGVTFRNAYANPVCSPTRACLITGRYGFRTGVGDVIAGAGSSTLPAAEFTLPEAFAANPTLGYQVAQFGKWHLANGVNSPGTIGGWPHYAGNLQGQITSYTSWTKTVNGVSTTSTTYATTDVVNDAVTWIQARGTNPWFAWVAFNAPHTPLHLPPTNLCPHYATLSGSAADIAANPRSYFAAMIEAMDTEIGRLLAAVDRSKTHIIFLGDNGTSANVIQPPYPGNRAKNTLYEGGVHVPFIIAGPAVLNPGRTNETPIGAVDVFATIADMAGINLSTTVPANVTLDSKSLLPMLTNDAVLSRCAYSELFGANVAAASAGRMLRNRQYKLIQFSSGQRALYDLLNDPYEGTNLLSGVLNSTQQSNYYSLTLKLAGYQSTLAQPVITSSAGSNGQFALTVQRDTNLTYALWRASILDDLAWVPLTNASVVTNSSTLITLTDSNATSGQSFYRVTAAAP
jgi:arylsulfatase B